MIVPDYCREVCAVTFDVDWSPDWIIDEVLSLCVAARARTTWFVTHRTPMLEAMRATGLVELGLHPNCLPNSTHGCCEAKVLEHIKSIVPEAVSMRTHGLYQTSAFLRRAVETGIRIDTSQFLPGTSHIVPHRLQWADGHRLWRVPFFWEDDVVMVEGENTWTLEDDRITTPGLKIFAFHPFHIVLNSRDFRCYEMLKSKMPMPNWTKAFIAPHRLSGPGPRTVLLNLLERLSDGGKTMVDLVPEALS